MKTCHSITLLTIILFGIIVAISNTCFAQTPAPTPQKSAVFMPLPSKERVAAERVQQRQIEERRIKEETIIETENMQIEHKCQDAVPLKAVEKMELKILEENPVQKYDNPEPIPENKK